MWYIKRAQENRAVNVCSYSLIWKFFWCFWWSRGKQYNHLLEWARDDWHFEMRCDGKCRNTKKNHHLAKMCNQLSHPWRMYSNNSLCVVFTKKLGRDWSWAGNSHMTQICLCLVESKLFASPFALSVSLCLSVHSIIRHSQCVCVHLCFSVVFLWRTLLFTVTSTFVLFLLHWNLYHFYENSIWLSFRHSMAMLFGWHISSRQKCARPLKYVYYFRLHDREIYFQFLWYITISI